MRKRPSQPIIPPDVLLEGYCNGIFPMADPDTGKIDWYSALSYRDPVTGKRGWHRGVIDLDQFHVPGRLRRELRKNPFETRFDTAFSEVIASCATRDQNWISPALRRSYEALHQVGYAHSVESWRDGHLEGGLYGVAIRGAFFGESMFYRASGASKAALIALVERLCLNGFRLLDIQMITPLTSQFGARLIPMEEYHLRLQAALEVDCAFGAHDIPPPV